jgi:hypothetical protein
MRMMLFAVPVAFSLACGADQPPVLVETPSPTSGATAIQAPDPPFTIEGPLAVEEAGAALETASAWEARVVVDKELQSVWIVSPTLLDAATQRHASLQLAWIDDATLAIASEGKTYAWQVGGPIEPRQLFLPTATPRTSTSVDNS